MKLVTYEVETPLGPVERLGDLRGDEIAELGGGDMIALLDGGEPAMAAARRILETRPKGSGLPLKGVRLKAPLKPRFLRDFFAFEDHAKAGAARRNEPLQKEWYDQPVYYKGNAREIYGPGDEIPWPAFTRKLDFEFEIAAVVGKKGRDIAVADAAGHIAGYIVMNDCSARDIQKNEMVCRMGPAKGKDFATVLGPWFVTADEWPTGEIPPLAVRVNGEEWSRSNGIQPYWNFSVMLSHASQSETMLPGDLLGSGTYFKGCGLDQDRWIQPGDELELDAGPLGVLKNKIGAPQGRTYLKYNRDGELRDMSVILTRGRVPRTPHTEYYSEPEVLALEEIHGAVGFSGDWSRKYHYRKYPTQQVQDPHKLTLDLRPQPLPPLPLQPWHLRTGRLRAHGDVVSGRVPLVYGTTTFVFAARFEKSCPADRFFRNGDGHELWFVQEGRGLLASEYGVLPFHKGHYVVIPKGTTYRVELESEECHLLMIESRFPIGFAPHYLNKSGQATLMSPVVETETALPEFRPPRDEEGLFRVWTKHGGGFITEMFLGHHPFDLIGWEGALYPYAFHTDDHHPLARQIHTAPPTRQTFESGSAPHSGFAVCTFKGQIEGWHPRDVPAPYAHFNADSDEVMFFSNTSYGARKGLVEPGSFTFHPGSLPHSPHGMAAKRSFDDRGKLSDYLAIMMDTFFEPLSVAKQAMGIADKDYPTSFNRDTQGFGGAA